MTRRRFATQGKNAHATTTTTTSKKWYQHDHPFMVGKRSFLGNHSVSEIAGNVSFVGVCFAYLHTDILMLRVLSMGSIGLSVAFQYYRAIPLWIPIRWNVLLLGINTVMTVSLMMERARAERMNEEWETIYKEGLFETRGFSKVEFLRLFETAELVVAKPGERLAEDGKVNRKLYFVAQGKIRIERHSKHIATVTPNHFIGEMTFLNHLCAACDHENQDGRTATADAVVEQEVVAYAWDFDRLKDYLVEEREVRNALSAYMNHDLREKLTRLNVKHAAKKKTVALLKAQVEGE